MIPYNIISSGSKGNAIIINGAYMIDCGVAKKALEPYFAQLRVIFLTHKHGDHFRKSTVKALAEERPTLRWACCSWMVPELLMAGVCERNIDVLTPGQNAKYSAVEAEPFLVTHDVPNCGYKFRFGSGSVFYATDCANLNGIHAEGYDLYLVEANHKTEEIDRKIQEKKASGEFAYEVRAKEMHLSEEDALDWLTKNMGEKSNAVYIHIHEERKHRSNE